MELAFASTRPREKIAVPPTRTPLTLFAALLLLVAPCSALLSAGQAPERTAADVRREARALIRSKDVTVGACLALADAAWKAGEAGTAIDLLDRGFELEPDHPALLEQARGLVDRVQFKLPLPPAPEVWSMDEQDLERSIERTFLHASKLPPTLQELSVMRLVEAAHSDFVRTHAVEALTSRQADERAFAALTLRRVSPGTSVAELIQRSLLDIDPQVRKQAAVGLSHVADPAVAGPAVRALGSKHAIFRLHAAEALGWMGHSETLPPLVEALLASNEAPDAIAAAPRAFAFFGTQTAYVQDFDAEVATGSSIADPVINVLAAGTVLDVRVIGTSASTVRRFDNAAMASLRRLSGENAGQRKRDWRAWWKDSDANPANAERVDAQSTGAGAR